MNITETSLTVEGEVSRLMLVFRYFRRQLNIKFFFEYYIITSN